MSLLNDLTLQQIFTRLAGFLIVIAVHGFVLAGLAWAFGDKGPRRAGRLTLNPLAHLSLPALAMAVLFQVGWLLPLRFNPSAMRLGRFTLVLTALGGLVATLALVPALGLFKTLAVVSLPRTTSLWVLTLLVKTQEMATWFVAVNLLPVPLLTGWLAVLALAPKLEPLARKAETAVMVLLVVLSVTGVMTGALAPLQQALWAAMPG